MRELLTLRRVIRHSILSEAKRSEAHILGLYEDMEMLFDDLRDLIGITLRGRLDHVEEKMDGQNLTFTVKDGELRIFGKGVGQVALEKGGLGYDDIVNHPRWNEKVKLAFKSAYEALESRVSQMAEEDVEKIFQDGKVAIEGQMLTPINPNTIPYSENHIRFVQPFTPYDDVEIDLDTYSNLNVDVELRDNSGTSWSMGAVPKLEQTKQAALNMETQIEELESELKEVRRKYSLTGKEASIGDYASAAMKDYIVDKRHDFIPDHLLDAAAERLVYGNKQALSKNDFDNLNDWKKFQEFEKIASVHVAGAIVDLEKIIQKLGAYFFDTLEFVLATNDENTAQLLDDVKKIRDAVASQKVMVKNVDTGEVSDMVDTAWATKLDVGLKRVDNSNLFKKAVEGIVFRVAGPDGKIITRKLTGMFTPIHRLVGMFKYPTQGKVREKLILIDDQPTASPAGVDESLLRHYIRGMVRG